MRAFLVRSFSKLSQKNPKKYQKDQPLPKLLGRESPPHEPCSKISFGVWKLPNRTL